MSDLLLPALVADRRKRRIGLLGGSFNPAHEGHRHISLMALHRLDLDEVWWLVSPQNPLKSSNGMAPLEARLDSARSAARHPRIKVGALESRLGTRYTADTLAALHKRFPCCRFVWLMGADNLAQIRHWEHWNSIFETTAIAVFARPAYDLRALGSLAAHRYAKFRRAPHQARDLALAKTPAWAFFPTRLNPQSATAIRRRRELDGIVNDKKSENETAKADGPQQKR
jgi:nicotinate-nucleotide adenylyltransferase